MKNTNIKRLLLITCLFFFVLLYLQARKSLSQKDYLVWINSIQSELIKDTTTLDYNFRVHYLPVDLIMLKEFNDLNNIDKKQFKILQKQNEGLHYFLLNIKPLHTDIFPNLKENFKDKNIFEREIEYFSFGMQKDLKLIVQGDTLKCLSFTHERTFNHTPFYTFLVAFELKKPNKTGEYSFLYMDKLLGTGYIKFNFPVRVINNFPKIKIENN